MWLNVYIHHKGRAMTYGMICTLADRMGLSCGLYSFKGVLHHEYHGEESLRLYDDYMGVALDMRVEEHGIELSLHYPAGPYDIDRFFRLAAAACEEVGESVFYLDTHPVSVTDVPNVIDFYIANSGEILTHVYEEFQKGERTGCLVIGTRFPMVLSGDQFRATHGDLYEFAFLIDRLQRTKHIYGDPEVYSYPNRKPFGTYDVTPNETYVLPRDPALLTATGHLKLNCWTVDFGWGQVKYEDFWAALPETPRFDHEHRIVCIDKETAESMVRRFGYDSFFEEECHAPSWGVPLNDMDGKVHADKVPDKGLDTDPLNGYSHLAAYLRWCSDHKLLNEDFLAAYPDLKDRIAAEKHDLRTLLKTHEAFRHGLRLWHLNEKGRAFAADYPHYSSDVDRWAEEYWGSEKYNCDEFQTEGYLFIPFDEDYYQGMRRYIDRAWRRFLRERKTA